MKTPIELLPQSDICMRPECDDERWCSHDVELVAQRAREEMRDMCATALKGLFIEVDVPPRYLKAVTDVMNQYTRAIRALPVTP